MKPVVVTEESFKEILAQPDLGPSEAMAKLLADNPEGAVNRIYLASSWRNEDQPRIVALLREAGYEVYDFRHPSVQGPPNAPEVGFAWGEIDPNWKNWTPEQYVEAMSHQAAVRGFGADFGAMQWSDTCVLLLPSGPSAAIEAGWCKGSGRRLIVHICGLREPDLMYKLANVITTTDEELLAALKGH